MIIILPLLHALFVTFSPNSPIFGTKYLSRRRFLQHYYRDTFIESHRKPTDLLEMCYSGRLIYKSLFLYQGYTKGIQKIGNSAQPSALKNFFSEKYTHTEIPVNIILPAYGICHITLLNLKMYAQKH